MTTELIIFTRPAQSQRLPGTVQTPSNSGTQSIGTYNSQWKSQPNNVVGNGSKYVGGKKIDLHEDVSIPITYSISDIVNPESVKTSWSKTITIPGTNNNNRIFGGIYNLQSDSWIQLGGVSVWSGFNPNLRTEVILLSGGIEVLKGNLQLKKATRDRGGNIEYEIALNGELTSLFSDIGDIKINGFDFTEYNHLWSRDNIVNSWSGLITNSSGVNKTSFTQTLSGTVSVVNKQSTTGRLTFTTTTPHGLSIGDYVRVLINPGNDTRLRMVNGDWSVVASTSTTFTVNYFYPLGLSPFGETGIVGYVWKIIHSGGGVVYPLIQWGDEVDYNTFPVTSFAPSYYLKTILDRIFKAASSTYESNFFDSQFFKRLILTQKYSQYDINPEETKSRKFIVGLTASYNQSPSEVQPGTWWWFQNLNPNTTATASTLPTQFRTRIPFNKEGGTLGTTASYFDNGSTQSGQFGNWNENTYQWIVSDNGEYNISANLVLDCELKMRATASLQPNTPGYTYFPGWIRNPSTVWNPDGNGVRLRATWWLERAGVQSEIYTSVSDQFYVNPQSYWSSTNYNWVNFGTYQPENWRNYQLTATCPTTYFSKGDKVWIELSNLLQAKASTIGGGVISFYEQFSSGGGSFQLPIVGDWKIKLKSGSYIFNEPTPKSVENSILEGSAFLPKDMMAKDFLLGLCKMFNLQIAADKEVERKYIIEPRDDFYYDGSNSNHFQNWTNKLHTDDIEIIPLSELTSKNYEFKNKEENDYYNTKFKNERLRPYSYYKKTIQNDFLKNTTTIELPFGTSVMTNVPSGTDVVLPAIYNVDGGNKKPIQTPAPRILIWGGLRPYTKQRGGGVIELNNPQTSWSIGWELLSGITNPTASISPTFSVYTTYPYAGTVDCPQDPLVDINWYGLEQGDFVYWDFARWTNNNLYNKYWSNFINEISDPGSKSITCLLKLTPKDINNLDFRKIYVLEGNWLRLQKIIDYDSVGGGLTRCQFLKLIQPTKYVNQNIIVNQWGQVANQFQSQYILNPHQMQIVGTSSQIEWIPLSKKPGSGFNNSIAGQDISTNTTIQISGQSNFVSPTSKNISIVGDENIVGDFTRNINIVNGRGNQVMGGLQNVSIIATDGKLILENDVSYINGVRFKFGNPISRSNVLDAGQDVAIENKALNTIVNVMDAGEDIVISSSTNGFENIMDAGVDMILPDLAEVGLTSLTNPNPRTNSSGGYITGSPTYSLINKIRNEQILRS